MGARGHVVIVYQFGKVASTALVKSLNSSDRIEAHQSHFLGDDALKRIVVNATSPNLTPYFRDHMVGQLLANLDLTQKLKQLQTGKDPRKLTVVSLARDPLDWFRSSIQQDIKGYAPKLVEMSNAGDVTGDAIEAGVAAVLSRILEVLEAQDGLDRVVERIVSEGGRVVLNEAGVTDEFIRTMYLLCLRPLTWFEDHFAKCFGFSLGDIPEHDRFWLRRGEPSSYVVLRYEDIADTFQPAMEAAGVPFAGEVVQANLSKSKSHAADIRAGFTGPDALRLGQVLRSSEYGRFFGYDTADATPSVATKVVA